MKKSFIKYETFNKDQKKPEKPLKQVFLRKNLWKTRFCGLLLKFLEIF